MQPGIKYRCVNPYTPRTCFNNTDITAYFNIIDEFRHDNRFSHEEVLLYYMYYSVYIHRATLYMSGRYKHGTIVKALDLTIRSHSNDWICFILYMMFTFYEYYC